MKITRDDILRAVSGYVQPLGVGIFDAVTGGIAKLKGLTENKTAEHYIHAMPYGFFSSPVAGVKAYILNIMGQVMAPVIIAHLDQNRPTLNPGESVQYSFNADGSAIQVTIKCGNDGTLTITAPTKVQLICDDVEIGEGTLEKVLNGETFQTFFNAHVHEGDLGTPTGPPMTPSDASHLSTQVKASK